MCADRGSLLLLLAIVGVAAALVAGLWLPGAHRAAEARRSIDAHAVELARLRADADAAPAAQAPEALTEACARAERAVPARPEMGPLLEQLSGDLAAEGLLVRQLRAQTSIRADGVERIPLTLQCEGTYPAIYAILERITDYERVVRIDSLGITGGGRDEAEPEGADDRAPAPPLLIDIELSTFCRVDEEDGP